MVHKPEKYTLQEVAILFGNLDHVTTVAPWMRYCYNQVCQGIIQALKHNLTYTRSNKFIQKYIQHSQYNGTDSQKSYPNMLYLQKI